MLSKKVLDECVRRGGRLKTLSLRYQNSIDSERNEVEAMLRAKLPQDLKARVRLGDIARIGGLARSEEKARAARDNGTLGGRPLSISKAARTKRLVRRKSGEGD